MSQEAIEHAFEPLFTTKRTEARIGLGLAQVQAMAEQAHGKALLVSKRNHGTTVTIHLPRAKEPTPSPLRPESLESKPHVNRQLKILIVEDNEEVAAGLAAVVEVLEWSAHLETSCDAAIERLESGDYFDLVLSDIQMPGRCDGLGLVAWIQKERPRQAITLMTGYAEHLEHAQCLGVEVLAKPFDIETLSRLLNKVASNSSTVSSDLRHSTSQSE